MFAPRKGAWSWKEVFVTSNFSDKEQQQEQKTLKAHF